MEKATKKQLEYISFIEEETGVAFKGKTKQEASSYINQNQKTQYEALLLNLVQTFSRSKSAAILYITC